MSANDEPHLRALCMSLGAQAYFPNLFDAEALIDAIKRIAR
jgi:hypothetical protein